MKLKFSMTYRRAYFSYLIMGLVFSAIALEASRQSFLHLLFPQLSFLLFALSFYIWLRLAERILEADKKFKDIDKSEKPTVFERENSW